MVGSAGLCGLVFFLFSTDNPFARHLIHPAVRTGHCLCPDSRRGASCPCTATSEHFWEHIRRKPYPWEASVVLQQVTSCFRICVRESTECRKNNISITDACSQAQMHIHREAYLRPCCAATSCMSWRLISSDISSCSTWFSLASVPTRSCSVLVSNSKASDIFCPAWHAHSACSQLLHTVATALLLHTATLCTTRKCTMWQTPKQLQRISISATLRQLRLYALLPCAFECNTTSLD